MATEGADKRLTTAGRTDATGEHNARHSPTAPAQSAIRHPQAGTRQSAIWDALRRVHDPEIPTISVVDLGIIHRVEVAPDAVRIEILPTFVGCPALEIMREQIREAIGALHLAPAVSVDVTFAAQWSSERITPEGHRRLREAGLAPPDGAPAFTSDAAVDLNPLGRARPPLAACPYCDSRNTLLENRFGPTLCRSIYYCNNCRQPFEAFKVV